jgi:cobalt/nickel transport system permease protein
MHIADGVLPTTVTITTYAISFAATAWSLSRVRNENLPKIAVVTSAFFVASLIHLPFGPTSVHLVLPGIIGVLLGPAAFLSVILGLFLQSILFQFGGLTAIGANAVMMGVPAVLCGLLFQMIRGKTAISHSIAGGICGGLGTVLAAACLAGLLATAGEDFLGVAKIALAAHIPVFIVEAGVSAFAVSFLFKVKPELLDTARLRK